MVTKADDVMQCGSMPVYNYHSTGFKCVVKRLRFRDFEEIAFLILAFVACDRLSRIRLYFILHFKDCNVGKNSKSAIFRLSHLKPVLW